MTRSSPVVHFEMPYRDADRISSFYESVFGWKMQNLGPDMHNYVMMETTDTQDGQATTPGHINGGLFEYDPEKPAQQPLIVISVDNIDEAIERVNSSGGKTFGDPQDIPFVGRYVTFQDCEGNAASMLQPAEM